MGLLNFWRKKESGTTAVAEPVSQPVIESEKRPVTESTQPKSIAQSHTESPQKSETSPTPPDPLQQVLDKIVSRPQGEFILFEHAADEFPKRILELGIDDGQRIETLLRFGTIVFSPEELLYVGLDWFDSRTPNQRPGLSYTKAMELISSIGVKMKLQPGDPTVTFLQIANALTSKKIDWILVSSEIPSKKMRTVWTLFPRILKPTTKLFLEKNGEYKLLLSEEIERVAKKAEKLGKNRSESVERR